MKRDRMTSKRVFITKTLWMKLENKGVILTRISQRTMKQQKKMLCVNQITELRKQFDAPP